MCPQLVTYPVDCCAVITLSGSLDKLLNTKQTATLIQEMIMSKNAAKSVMQT